MARSKQQQALSKVARAWNVSEDVAKQRIEALPHSRVRDRYRAAETRVSRELGVESIYAPQSRRPKSVQTDIRPAPSSWNWTPVKVETRVQPQHDYAPSSRTRQSPRVSPKPYVEHEAVDDVVADFSDGIRTMEYDLDRYERFRNAAETQANRLIAKVQEQQAAGMRTPEDARRVMGNIRGMVPPDLVSAINETDMDADTMDRVYKDLKRFDTLIAGDFTPEEKGARSWTIENGRIVNPYTKAISEDAVAKANEDVIARRESIAQDRYGMSWDELPKNIQYVLDNNYNLSTVSEKLSASTAYSAATGLYELSDKEYMKNYLRALKDSEFNSEAYARITEIVEEIIDTHPGALRDIIMSGDDEVNIEYLYRDTTKSTPYHTSMTERESNVLMYWENRYNEILNRKGSTR